MGQSICPCWRIGTDAPIDNRFAIGRSFSLPRVGGLKVTVAQIVHPLTILVTLHLKKSVFGT